MEGHYRNDELYASAAEGKYSLTRTILAIFENGELKKNIEQWAKKNDCSIHWGDPEAPDICAIPNFAMIVDRRVLGENIYDMYLQDCKDELEVAIEEIKRHYADGSEEVIWKEGDEEMPLAGQVDEEDIEESWACRDICIFIDDSVGAPTPKTEVVVQISPESPHLMEWVNANLDVARKTVVDRVYGKQEASFKSLATEVKLL